MFTKSRFHWAWALLGAAFAGLSIFAFSQLAKAESPYMTTYGGAIVHDGFSGSGGGTSYEVDADTGYVIGGIVGFPTNFLEDSSVEFEASYRSAGLDGLVDPNCGPDFPLGGSDQTFGVTVNLRQSVRVLEDVSLWASSGVGYGWRRISLTPNPSNFALNGGGADEAGMIWQAAAGVEYDLDDNWSIGARYQYFNSLNIDRGAVFGKSETFFESEGDSHAALLSVTQRLQ